MHQVKLSALELTVELENHKKIVDHGFVDDMVEHTRRLFKERNMPHTDYHISFLLSESWFFHNGYGGHFFYEVNQDGIFFHYRYISSGNPDKDLVIRAHEEIHVVEECDKLLPFRFEIQRILNIDIDLNKYHSETKANMGGILALIKKRKSKTYVKDIITSMSMQEEKPYKQEALNALKLT